MNYFKAIGATDKIKLVELRIQCTEQELKEMAEAEEEDDEGDDEATT